MNSGEWNCAPGDASHPKKQFIIIVQLTLLLKLYRYNLLQKIGGMTRLSRISISKP